MGKHLVALSTLTLAFFLFIGCGSGGGGGNSGSTGIPTATTIGPDGGTLDDGNGLKITVPPGALTSSVQISAARTTTPGPSGNGALSNLYQFGPDGTVFRQPVTVTLPLPAGAPANVTIFWSQSGNPSSYEDVSGAVTGSSISAAVTHLSTGFVGTLLSMANWVHIAHPLWAYWIPNNNWQHVESTSGIDISSPTGDASVEFAFAYGPLVPTTLDAAEAQLRQLFTNFSVLNQSPITPGPYYGGSSRTTEFTAVSGQTNVHGKLTVDIGYQTFDAYLMIANTQVWPTISPTLQLIRDHIVHCGAGLCGP